MITVDSNGNEYRIKLSGIRGWIRAKNLREVTAALRHYFIAHNIDPNNRWCPLCKTMKMGRNHARR